MGKIGKTFTIDLDVYNWLEKYAEEKKRKVSYVVNAALRKTKNEIETWDCDVCGKNNGSKYTTCWNEDEHPKS